MGAGELDHAVDLLGPVDVVHLPVAAQDPFGLALELVDEERSEDLEEPGGRAEVAGGVGEVRALVRLIGLPGRTLRSGCAMTMATASTSPLSG